MMKSKQRIFNTLLRNVEMVILGLLMTLSHADTEQPLDWSKYGNRGARARRAWLQIPEKEYDPNTKAYVDALWMRVHEETVLSFSSETESRSSRWSRPTGKDTALGNPGSRGGTAAASRDTGGSIRRRISRMMPALSFDLGEGDSRYGALPGATAWSSAPNGSR